MDDSKLRAAALRILVVRLGAMGDVVHAMPAVARLRSMFPAAEIGWAIESRWVDLLASQPWRCTGAAVEGAEHPLLDHSAEHPLVDRIHLVNTLVWRSAPLSDETWKQAGGAVRGLRQLRYDIAVDFQGSWKSATLALLSGARERVGFRQPRERGASLFYNCTAIARGAHVVEQNLALLPSVSALVRDGRAAVREAVLREPAPPPQLPQDEAQALWARQELVGLELWGREFAIINPGAGWGAKRWPAERFAEVARGLHARGVPALVNYGPGEQPMAQAVEAASAGAARARRYTLGELIALLRQARLFVGGDTGPTHLAAALRVPVVAVFGPTDPARNGPYGTDAIVLRSPASTTDHSRRKEPEPAMLTIAGDDVLRAALLLLERTPPRQEAHRA